MEPRQKIIHRKGKHIVAGFHSDVLQSDLNVVIFPFGKVNDHMLRKLTGISDLEYERSYDCYGSVFSNDETNTETLVLQLNQDGAVYMDVLAHEALHVAGNIFTRIHQTVDFSPGGDEILANTVGTVANHVYAILLAKSIPLAVG